MMKNLLILFVLLSLLLAGCSTMDKAQQGALIGVGSGALIGGEFGPNGRIRAQNALIGGILGGIVGYMVGNEMDKYDRQKLIHAMNTSPSYQTTTWTNPDTKKTFSVTPYPAYENNKGLICRKAYITGIINGEQQQIETTACRQPDGQWKLIR